jgi:hypothetical protein
MFSKKLYSTYIYESVLEFTGIAGRVFFKMTESIDF